MFDKNPSELPELFLSAYSSRYETYILAKHETFQVKYFTLLINKCKNISCTLTLTLISQIQYTH